jgi:hypothetical protein
MWNKIILVSAITVIMLPAVWGFSEMKPKPVSNVLAEIRQEQGLKAGDTIKADKVTLSKLEELGDSVMEARERKLLTIPLLIKGGFYGRNLSVCDAGY